MRLDVPIQGYQPDADPFTPGVITDCQTFIPTIKGYVAAPEGVELPVATLADHPRGAAAVILLDATNRVFAGTEDKLYERTGFTWTDVSRVGDYASGPERRWRFAQFGNATIATNRADAMQVSVTSGDFADLGGSPPKAGIVFTVGDFVMTLDYDDGVDDYPDGWYCSGIGNHAEWDTTDVATQSANGRLLDIPGPIKAGARLGSQAAVYKENGIWLGTYQGPPLVWAWQFIPGGAGCVSQEALVEVTVNGGPAHVFMGVDDVYLFDGSRPVSLGTGKVRQFLQNNLDHRYRQQTLSCHDRANGIIRFFFVSKSNASTRPDMCLAYNYLTNQFGRDDRDVHAAIEYVNGNITWDDLGTLYSTWEDLPIELSYDSPYWSASQTVPIVFGITDELLSLTGAAGSSSFTTGYLGDADDYATVERVRLRYIGSTSATGTMINYYLHDIGDSDTTGETTTLNGSKFDVMRSARWHKFKFNMDGDYGVSAIRPTYSGDGSE
jgi:hypothetical protein